MHEVCATVRRIKCSLIIDGADFTASGQTVTFPVSDSGQRQCVEIDIMDDPVVEGDEPFSVGFELPPGVQPGPNPETIVTILDDDGVCYELVVDINIIIMFYNLMVQMLRFNLRGLHTLWTKELQPLKSVSIAAQALNNHLL